MNRDSNQTNDLTRLSPSEMEALDNIAWNFELFSELEEALSIKISAAARMHIERALTFYTDLEFFETRDTTQAEKSSESIVKALDRLFSEFERQRQLDVYDSGREGYEYFVQYSQLPYFAPDEQRSNDTPSQNNALDRAENPCRDRFDCFAREEGFSVANYHSLLERQGWLEQLLREIRGKLSFKSPKQRGPKGKARKRNFFIRMMAEAFEGSGGKVRAYKDPISGQIKGDFVFFVGKIVEACPLPVRHRLGVGMDVAIERWVRAGGLNPLTSRATKNDPSV